ncbi:MAG: flavodoxin family protein [Acidobacteria bacterium]|nr:flavodoxin family protein [Acidobacteriota bacterium]
MNIVTVMGSPRPRGNTATVLGWLEETFRDRGHDVDPIIISEHTVYPCQACAVCKRVTDAPGCVQRDDAEALFRRMMAAHVLVYATPLYCWEFSAQLKPLIDRHYCLVTDFGGPDWNSLLRGKRAGLLVTCAGPVADNADLIQQAFVRMMEYIQCRAVECLVVPFCTTPDQLGVEARERAVFWAERLLADRF